jgi:hypothetical protein
MTKKLLTLFVMPMFLFGCSAYNQPKPDYNHKKAVQDTIEKASESYKEVSVEKKVIKKEAGYNDILNRYQLPSDNGTTKKDNKDLSVGEKQTIKINVQ